MTFFEFTASLNVLSPVLMGLGLLAGAYYYKKLDSLHKSLIIYFAIMFGTDQVGRFLGNHYGNNLIMLPVYSLLELAFFVYFYNRFLLKKHNKVFITLGLVGMTYIVAEIFYFFILNEINFLEFQPYAKVADNFVVIIMVLAFFLQSVNAFSQTGWQHFGLNIAILSFFTITTIIFLPFNFLVNDPTGLKFYFWMMNTLSLICFETYLVALVVNNGRTVKNS